MNRSDRVEEFETYRAPPKRPWTRPEVRRIKAGSASLEKGPTDDGVDKS